MIVELLEGKNAKEKADIKADKISLQDFSSQYTEDGITITIQKVTKIEGGIELLAKAWKGTKQLGFGKNGTIETERFRIINPPVLVPDVDGTIVRIYTDDKGKTETRKLREDPLQATILSLAHTIKLVGKEDTQIIPGSIGNTTTTVYPDPDPETTSVDGRAFYASIEDTFANVRAAAGTTAEPSTINNNHAGIASTATTDRYDTLIRGIFLFDTSSIPDADTIDSATFSLWGTAKTNTFTTIDSVLYVVASTPATNTNIVTGDYQQLGTTSFGTVTYANYDGTNTVYTDIALNASGLAAITATSVSKFGTRFGADFNNTAPTWEAAKELTFKSFFADQAGTTNDPKLVVVHSAAGAGGTKPNLLLLGVG